MKKNILLKKFATQFWGLPLLLPLIMMPMASALSVRLWLPEGYVYLIYLPLAMMIALMMVFHWSALPGIAIALCWHYFNRYTPAQAIIIISVFLITLSLCWGGYSIQAHRRWRAGFGEMRTAALRLFWLAFAMPTLFIVLLQIVTPMNILPLQHSVFVNNPFTIRTLLNYQSALLALLATAQLFYFVLRVIRNPRFFYTLRQRCRSQFAGGVTLKEWLLWLGLVLFLMLMLMQFRFNQENLLTTDYGLPLLLPLMLWSATRFGYLFTSFSWGMMLVVLYQLRDRFMSPPTDGYHLAVISANLLVFTLTILMLSALSTRQRRLLEKASRMALTDPVIGLPNVRALSQALAKSPGAVLCFLRIPDLDRLSRTYGLQLRIQYKRSLADHLKHWLQPSEDVYQLPGFDLALRLEHSANQARIESLEARLKDYHLSWDGLPIHPDVGISYCSVLPPVLYLYELLGEMSAMAEVALHSGHAENLQQKDRLPAQRQVTEKLAMLQDIQLAMQNGGFYLMMQKIQGVRGDDYYEILLRMVDSRGEHIKPAEFIPIVQEFGLTWEVDRLVLEQILTFVDSHREQLPGIRFAVNLFADTLCRPQLAAEIATRLRASSVEPWQLIIEVDESPMLSNYSWGNRNIAQLRQLGCRVAIDDFGTGYASYSRLKQVQVDILKIDGSFVRNMLNSSLDYRIIESICVVARLKRMQIVAEFVETEDTASALRKLGVDYLQGYVIGEPEPLKNLLSTPDKEDEISL